MTAAKKHLGYIPALDGIRAGAVLLVMLAHTGVPGFVGGGLGVDMFFVLSGFLITALLLEEIAETGRIRMLHFYARRALRLYPALLLLLVLYGVFVHIVHHVLAHTEQLESAKDISLAALYLTDYAVAFGFENKNSLLAHTWSLSVEEHFYLIWPWALIGLRRVCPGRKLVTALIFLYAVATGWRLLCLSFQPWEMVYFRFDTRLAGLVLGACLAAIRAQGVKIPQAMTGLIVSGAMFLICILMLPTFGGDTPADVMRANTAETSFAEVFTFFLIFQVLEARKWPVTAWLSHKAPVFFGRISYALYLFHFPVAALFLRSDTRWWIAFEITLAVAVALAWFSWNTVEKAGRVKAKEFRRGAAGRHLPTGK